MFISATTLHFLRVPAASLPRRAPSPDLRLAHLISSLSSDVQKSSLLRTVPGSICRFPVGWPTVIEEGAIQGGGPTADAIP